MKKNFDRLGRILGVLLTVVLCLITLSAAVQSVLTAAERSRLAPQGTMVEVNGKQMCVAVSGNGTQTVVLMSGLGTAAPILDFAPLTQQLAQFCRVVVVEPFGYGWSDVTQAPRDVETIVGELRSALRGAGVEGPYILMPHSLSGIYALAYACAYPQEVSGVIGIDCALPRQMEYFGQSGFGQLPGFLQAANSAGVYRWLAALRPELFVSDNDEGAYSPENLQLQQMLAAEKGYNVTVLQEANAVDANVKKTRALSFRTDLPLLFLIRSDKLKTPRADGKTSRSFFETYLTNSDCQTIQELDGPHYLHWTQSSAMAQAVKSFLQKNVR